ncbi:MAG: hypothetical protein KDD59_06065 [Bdellovibrionales bacterium]|nr:hypothetical protein [Bdellovibrionales bacterium]
MKSVNGSSISTYWRYRKILCFKCTAAGSGVGMGTKLLAESVRMESGYGLYENLRKFLEFFAQVFEEY